MSYQLTGLGALTASAELSMHAGTSSGSSRTSSSSAATSPPPSCVTAARRLAAVALCKIMRHDCDIAALPLCRTPPPPPPVVAPVKTVLPNATATAFRAAPPVAPSSTGQQKLVGKVSAAPGTYAKLPVPPAAPIEPLPVEPAPEGGVPVWIWIAGGAAVLGTGAFLYTRRKKAS